MSNISDEFDRLFFHNEEKHAWKEGMERNPLIRFTKGNRRGLHFQFLFLELIRRFLFF